MAAKKKPAKKRTYRVKSQRAKSVSITSWGNAKEVEAAYKATKRQYHALGEKLRALRGGK